MQDMEAGMRLQDLHARGLEESRIIRSQWKGRFRIQEHKRNAVEVSKEELQCWLYRFWTYGGLPPQPR